MINPKIIGVAEIWGEGPYDQIYNENPWASEAPKSHVVIFNNGIFITHHYTVCEGPCAIHGPSDHHMWNMPVFYRPDRAFIERKCEHGVGHPDPDQITFWQQNLSEEAARAQSVHGCCGYGCCETPGRGEEHE